jgi:hypothetical protein
MTLVVNKYKFVARLDFGGEARGDQIMKARFALPISAGIIMTSVGFLAAAPAQARMPTFPTYQECIDYITDIRRGNHALVCEWNGSAWTALYDNSYKPGGGKKPK